MSDLDREILRRREIEKVEKKLIYMSPYRTSPVSTDQMPPGIPYIISNEAAERFSFYGMKTILAVFSPIIFGL